MNVRTFRSFDSTLTGILAIIAAALLLLSLVPSLHKFWWVFELPSHFRLHIAVGSTVLGVFALTMKSWISSALALATACLCWTTVLTMPKTPASEFSGISVVSQNLNLTNEHADEAIRVLTDEDPHILVLQEYTPVWHQALKSVADRYLHRMTVPQEGAFGIAVFSRIPVNSYEVLTLGDAGSPAITLEVDTPRAKIQLVAVHLQPPMSDDWSSDRNRQLNELKQYLLGLDGAYVVVGDFNNTPFSPSLQAFIDEARLKLGRSISPPTWPSILGWVGIPIDLVLGSETVTINSIRKIDSMGSDHRGLRFSVTTQR